MSNDCVNWFEGKSDVRYLRVPIDDEVTADASRFFAATHAFIEQVHRQHVAGHKACVMVHCKTGMSRSTTIVLSHMLQAPGMLRYIAEFTDRQGLLVDHGAGDDDDCDAAGAREAGRTMASMPAAQLPSTMAARPTSGGSRFAHRTSPYMTLRDALAYVRERRPRASPNAGAVLRHDACADCGCSEATGVHSHSHPDLDIRLFPSLLVQASCSNCWSWRRACMAAQ